jgi:glutaredoxin
MNSKQDSGDIPLWVILTIVFGVIAVGFILYLYPTLKFDNIIQNNNSEIENSSLCKDIYLNMCFDNTSKYYKCNIKNDICDIEDYKMVNIIRTMETNNIVIYGLTTCQYCQKEYSEFGNYGISAIDKGVFVFCDNKSGDKEFLDGCTGVITVPTWKMNGEIVGVGYYELEKSVNILIGGKE